MHILARSMLTELAQVFLLAVAVVTPVMLLVGVAFDLPREFGAWQIVMVLPYLLPEALRNSMQAAALFAACSVFGRMAASNELLALSSLGISLDRVVRPVLILATLLSLTCVWLYDAGERWGKPGVKRVLSKAVVEITYKMLRAYHAYDTANMKICVKGVKGRSLIHPTLLLPASDGTSTVISAEEGKLYARDNCMGVVLQNGTIHTDRVTAVFPDTIEQVVSFQATPPVEPSWRPEFCTLPELHAVIRSLQGQIARLAHAARIGPTVPAPPHEAGARGSPAAVPTIGEQLATARQHLHWLQAKVYRQWANGFFCLAFVTIGIPVAIKLRRDDHLSSFFVCFMPIIAMNHPLHSICIQLAEAGHAPPWWPCVGDAVLMTCGVGLFCRWVRI